MPMMDRALLNDNGVGGNFDLAAKDFKSTVIAAWPRLTLAWDLATKKEVMLGRKSDEFVKTWRLESESHTPGGEIAGQTLEKDVLIVELEDEETIAFAFQTNVDRFIVHYDHRGRLAIESTRGIARTCDRHVLQEAIVGARTAGSGSFPGGQTLTSPRAGGSLAAVYPLSVDGSKKLQDDFGEIMQKMFEDDVPEETEFHAFLGAYLHRVLRQDDSLLNSEYTGVNESLSNKLTGKLMMIENCWIHKSNNVPSTDLSGNTKPIIAGSVAYALDFTTTAAVIMGPDAVATVHTGGIMPAADWLPQRRVYQIGSAIYKGHKAFRFETCGEIAIA